jgi:hypothetical protein
MTIFHSHHRYGILTWKRGWSTALRLETTCILPDRDDVSHDYHDYESVSRRLRLVIISCKRL